MTMQRTKSLIKPNGSGYVYPIGQEPIILFKSLFDLLLKQDNPSALIGLYSFYYYTAKWQKTNQPKATVEYVGRALKWSAEKVRKYRRQLLDLNLIEDVTVVDRASGQISGHFVKVNFLLSESHPPGKPPCGEHQPQVLPKGNALSSNNKNNITPTKFHQFWYLYPKKMNKGKTLTAWLNLCKKKDAPSWSIIKEAIDQQMQSAQWQDPKFIPHPTTWLNQRRWLDDAKQMVSYSRSTDKPEKILEYGEWWYLDKNRGEYFNKACQLLIK